jgi:hypothetical protein
MWAEKALNVWLDKGKKVNKLGSEKAAIGPGFRRRLSLARTFSVWSESQEKPGTAVRAR